MRFDQVRREYKKTLWGEELDNEKDVRPFELSVLNKSESGKCQCAKCTKEYDAADVVIYQDKIFCTNCFQERL